VALRQESRVLAVASRAPRSESGRGRTGAAAVRRLRSGILSRPHNNAARAVEIVSQAVGVAV